MADRPQLNDDFVDIIRSFQQSDVDFMIIGAHALAVHGIVRSTGDLDIFVRPSPQNAERVFAALEAFGAPLRVHGIEAADFSQHGTVYQLGLPPRRIDILTTISGVDFDDASTGARHVELEGLRFRVPSREVLLINKRASGRPKDLEDARKLEASLFNE
jgi:hypothetical protein